MSAPQPLQRALGALYGGWCALIFGLLIFGLLSACVLLAPGVQRRRRVAGLIIRATLWLCASPLRVEGVMPATKPVMVVANHASYLDGLVLTAALGPEVSYVVKDDASSWPLVGRVLQRLGVVFIARDEVQMSARQTRTLLKRMRAGDSLGIFPEGTFRAEPGLLPFKLGAFMLAARTGTIIVPVAIRGSREFYGHDARLPTRSPITVAILPPEPCDGISAETLAKRVRRRMQQALPEEHPSVAGEEVAA
jgi:1-acyl-sn-glycerol-3-phosphate acyltransferase